MRKNQAPKLADAIVAELEQMIADGSLQPGQKLLPERELAVQFQVSRPSLREAIQRLEAKGLLWRRQGGGTYVQQALSRGLTDPLFELLLNNPNPSLICWNFVMCSKGWRPITPPCGYDHRFRSHSCGAGGHRAGSAAG